MLYMAQLTLPEVSEATEPHSPYILVTCMGFITDTVHSSSLENLVRNVMEIKTLLETLWKSIFSTYGCEFEPQHVNPNHRLMGIIFD